MPSIAAAAKKKNSSFTNAFNKGRIAISSMIHLFLKDYKKKYSGIVCY